jgi:hypothetical protein
MAGKVRKNEASELAKLRGILEGSAQALAPTNALVTSPAGRSVASPSTCLLSAISEPNGSMAAFQHR